MSLVEGEEIEEIEKSDEGWWYGVGANGAKSGWFPCMSEGGILCGQSNIFPTRQLHQGD